LASLPSTGADCVVVSHPTPMPPLQASGVRPRFFHGRDKSDLRGNGLRALVFGVEPDGSRVIYDCPLRKVASRLTAPEHRAICGSVPIRSSTRQRLHAARGARARVPFGLPPGKPCRDTRPRTAARPMAAVLIISSLAEAGGGGGTGVPPLPVFLQELGRFPGSLRTAGSGRAAVTAVK